MVGDGGDATSYSLTSEQQKYAAWGRSVAAPRADTVAAEAPAAPRQPAGHGAVDRPLIKAMGDAGLLRGLFGGAKGGSPRDPPANELCLLREMLATVDTEAETALALQGLGCYPILQSG